MIAVDTNILVYAHRRDSAFHSAAAGIMVGLAEGDAEWAIPWPCIHEFISVVTHPRVFAPPSTLHEAVQQVDAWMASPALSSISETKDHWPALKDLAANGKILGPAIHDARIAAICATNGVAKFLSADRDFSRYGGLKVVNPLV